MNGFSRLFCSSIGKKYLMAISGVILTGFVLGHMLGNLQFFLAPHWINEYAHHLQNMPYGLLWVVRTVMITAVITHIWTGITLAAQNRAARPGYAVEATVQASKASRTMIWTGLIIAAFIVFHIMHYTVKNVYDYSSLTTELGEYGTSPDVHTMMYLGFSHWYVSLFYVVATGLLMLHLSHGVSSMFQSIGMRNETWRTRLGYLACAYGWAVFLGFAAIPVYVLLTLYIPGFDPLNVITPEIQAAMGKVPEVALSLR